MTFIKEVFQVMNECSRHNFQILTKRSKRLAELAHSLNWTSNIWMGVSVENQDYAYRVNDLRSVPAHIRFLSLEPLIGPIYKLNLCGIHWVIVGGESGPGARPMKEEWVLKIRDICRSKNIPFFFKQWGEFNKKRNGRKLEDRYWNEMPIVKSQPLFDISS